MLAPCGCGKPILGTSVKEQSGRGSGSLLFGGSAGPTGRLADSLSGDTGNSTGLTFLAKACWEETSEVKKETGKFHFVCVHRKC